MLRTDINTKVKTFTLVCQVVFASHDTCGGIRFIVSLKMGRFSCDRSLQGLLHFLTDDVVIKTPRSSHRTYLFFPFSFCCFFLVFIPVFQLNRRQPQNTKTGKPLKTIPHPLKEMK